MTEIHEELAETLGNDLAFADVAEAVCTFDERVRMGQDTKAFALTYLYREIDGDGMIARGQRTKTAHGYRFHVSPPQEREYCTGCEHSPTLLYQCTTPIDERLGVIRRMDSRPSMYVTRVKKGEE
jgi:hypothetical protein